MNKEELFEHAQKFAIAQSIIGPMGPTKKEMELAKLIEELLERYNEEDKD